MEEEYVPVPPGYPEKSFLKPWVQRDHAWNDAQENKSNEDTWDAQTEKETGYKLPYPNLVQYPGESKSYIKNYN